MGTVLASEIEAKSAPVAVEVAPTSVDATDDPMVYRIIASVTGVLDQVGDVVMPGAFTKTLAERTPKMIEAHDWTKPIGKILEVEELLPGDPRLPAETAQGKPWPKEAGALVAKVHLFKNPAGEAAKVRWDAYGPDQQFSIGYRPKRATKDRRGVRSLHEVDLYEFSDVLWGAMPLAGPMPAALAAKVIAGMGELEVKGAEQTGVVGTTTGQTGRPDDEWAGVDPDALYAAAEDDIDWDEADRAAGGPPDPAGSEAGDGPADGESGTGGPPDDTADAPPPDEGKQLDVTVLTETLALLPHDSEFKRKFDAAQRAAAADAGTAMADGSFPIANLQDLRNAVPALGRAKDKAKAKAHIVRRARALGHLDKLPADWGTKDDDDADVEGKAQEALPTALPAITDRDSLVAAVQMVSAADDPAAARATVVKAAARLGMLDVVPESWEEALQDAAEHKDTGGDVEGKAAASAADQKKKDDKNKQQQAQSQDEKHPHQPPGSPKGGQFAPKDGSSSSSSSSSAKPGAAGGGGLPGDWMAQIQATNPQFAAHAGGGGGGGGGGKGKGKAGAAAKAAARAAKAAKAKKAREDRKAAAAGKRATSARMSAADKALVNKEMDRRSAVEKAFNARRDAEDAERAKFDAALAKVTDPAQKRAMKATEKDRRAAWNGKWRADRTVEMDRRRAWSGERRHAALAKAAVKAKAAAAVGAGAAKKPVTPPKPGTQKKDADVAEVVEVDDLTPHPYDPAELGCAECDESAADLIHTDDASTRATMVFAESVAWRADPLPDTLLDDDDAGDAGDVEGKAAGGADRNRGNAEKLRRYWTVGPGAAKIGWGTPGDFDRCVTHLSKYMGERAKGYCNRRHVDVLGAPPGKGHGKGLEDDTETKLDAWTPDAEVGEHAAHLPPPPETKDVDVDNFPGTLEERRDKVRDAVTIALRGAPRATPGSEAVPAGWTGPYEWDHVSVQGTWPDHVIATRRNWENGRDDAESFDIPYLIDITGNVALGVPQPVTLQAMVVPDAPDTPDDYIPVNPAADMVNDAAYVVKAILGAEGKVGRMLSGMNSTRIREAVTTLLAVLLDAGVEITPPNKPVGPDRTQQAVEPPVRPDTTSAAAREGKDGLPDGMVRLPADVLAEVKALTGR